MSEVQTRKDQIHQIATNLFKERGYTATSMRDLAKEIGVEAASLYSHISSKEEILQTVCFNIAQEFFEAIYGVKQLNLTPEEMLCEAIKAHVHVIAHNLDAAPVFLNEWRFLSEPHLTEFKKMRDDYEEEFRQIISNGISNGYFEKKEVAFTVLTIFSSLNWIYQWYDPQGTKSIDEIGEELSQIILHGIEK